MKKKPTVNSTFWGAFRSDRIPKTTKDVHVRLFIHSNNSCKLYQRIPINYMSEIREHFETTTKIKIGL